MGQEIDAVHFQAADFQRFKAKLTQETALLQTWFEQQQFEQTATACGYELEAWLVDEAMRPAPVNAAFLATMDQRMATPELASFNVEFNFTPQNLTGTALSTLHTEMDSVWAEGRQQAQALGVDLMQIGILPTVEPRDLTTAHISGLKRYQALNEQVLRLREGRPLELDIHGTEILRHRHEDVMLESVTTSFQIHIQVPLAQALRAYNAAIILSAPMVAVSANSPFLFGKDLWAETRIPVFEQAVAVGGLGEGAHGPMRRVTFGSGYARNSLMECFTENIEHYPILLPTQFEDPIENLAHVRLHNGTLWRWNRPLIGVDTVTPHIRIEHRVVPAGPTNLDATANAALFYGLLRALMDQQPAPELEMPFEIARDNFYHAAQHGLDAHIIWLDGKKQRAQQLLLSKLIPLARSGLESMHMDQEDVDRYLGIIEARCSNACNGAAWQRAFVTKHGRDWTALARAYLDRQNSGEPVHQWTL